VKKPTKKPKRLVRAKRGARSLQRGVRRPDRELELYEMRRYMI